MVGSIVMFVPKDDKVFPYNLNGAKELPAIVIQDFGGYQNLGVVTPFDGVRSALSVKQDSHGYETESYWYKKECENCFKVSGELKTEKSNNCDPKFLVDHNNKGYQFDKDGKFERIVVSGSEIELGVQKKEKSKSKYPIQKNKKSTKKADKK